MHTMITTYLKSMTMISWQWHLLLNLIFKFFYCYNDNDKKSVKPTAKSPNIILYQKIPIPSSKMTFTVDEDDGNEGKECDDKDEWEIIMVKYVSNPKLVQKSIDGKLLKSLYFLNFIIIIETIVFSNKIIRTNCISYYVW